jgi:hypothetical protein
MPMHHLLYLQKLALKMKTFYVPHKTLIADTKRNDRQHNRLKSVSNPF